MSQGKKKRNLPRKTTVLIAVNTMFLVFALASGFSGTIAWFLSQQSVDTTAGDFKVVSLEGDCELVSIELVKFDYFKTVYNEGAPDEFTVIDYIRPETGSVNRYEYNDSEDSFGFFDEETWKEVSIMNTYDPIEMIISGDGLRDLNCNAIYEIVVESENLDLAYINAAVSKISEKAKEEDDLFFTTCTNFDIFFEGDLSLSTPLYYQWNAFTRRWASTYDKPTKGSDKGACANASDLPLNPSGGDYYFVNNHDTRPYIPSYKDNVGPRYHQWDGSAWEISEEAPLSGNDKGEIGYIDELPESPSNGDYYLVDCPLTKDEDLYYKLSFLSSAKSSHAHFYGSEASQISIEDNVAVDFDDHRLKFYVNVNYAPDQLEGYSKDIYKKNYKAVYDFYFNFSFSNREEGA